FEDESELYITMEYLSHGDLHNYLKTEAALPELDAQQIAIQICEGLSMMHENGFAHRDLKPGNILIHGKPPGQWWIKIADFGISKRTEHTIAGPSTRKGTETFMPPEWHGFGSGEDDGLPNMPQAIDMWSLGETISRMITKEATFKTPYDLFRFAEAQDMFPEQSLRAHNASADAIDLITALMKLSPEARLTASQALQHRWLHTDSPSHSREPSIASL
ncbi:kinase-like domain-containing protein, partial [Lophiotrema nucula]